MSIPKRFHQLQFRSVDARETRAPSPRMRMIARRQSEKRQIGKRERKVDIVILGAGLAGTSLAHHLEQLGFRGTIALLDNRADFSREQRWCTWSDVPASMLSTVSHRWNAWQVRDEKHVAHCASDEYSYQEIYAPHFFQSIHSGWRDGGQIEIHLSQNIESVRETDDEMTVETDSCRWRAAQVFDSRFHSELDDAQSAPTQTPHIFLAQTFVGRVVEFERDVFDASCATLMDFRVPQLLPDGVSFAYVLPYNSRRALIETTTFSPQATPRKIHNAMLNAYIVAHFGGAHRTISHESGFVPMTTAPASATSSTRCSTQSRWTRIGVAGGQARASSGYAFGRIQRATLDMARQIVGCGIDRDDENSLTKTAVRSSITPAKYRVLDEIFLEALSVSPQFAGECFVRLFKNVPTGSLVRFLDDRSSLLDDARLICALPKLQFLAATARRASAHFPAC